MLLPVMSRWGRQKAPFALMAIIISTLPFLIGCDLVTTRSPEEPQGGGAQEWRFPSTPEVLLDNLTSSFYRRSSTDYYRCLVPPEEIDTPPFQYQPDPQTESNHPGYFSHWDVAREEKFIRTLFSSSLIPLDSLLTFVLTVERKNEWSDSATVSAHYRSHLGHIRPQLPREVEGRMELRLVKRNTQGWAIQLWSDRRLGALACWSDLKALL